MSVNIMTIILEKVLWIAMIEIFADTSGWANFLLKSEPFHEKAKYSMEKWHSEGNRIVTSNYILLELIALFTRPLNIPRINQIKIIETIKNTPWVEIVHIDSSLDDEAWRLLKDRKDKTWSLVDCTSFTIMHHRKILEAFTADRHFEQAGFLRTLS